MDLQLMENFQTHRLTLGCLADICNISTGHESIRQRQQIHLCKSVCKKCKEFRSFSASESNG